ncbi:MULTISPECIES: phosphodiesterase [Micrococcaceae]|uniref:phosphodiesterase n=1 Tax=Micrococcaceae TaxID=1268 RepID=UPI000BB8D0C6|nr:phosphodiesterase [Glutamicibacter sp. BW78]PCC25120.1 phosphodiesterase [Glutamicibacter sp. BW78]
MEPIRPEHPAPDRVLIHLSDTHVRGGGHLLADTLDSIGRLRSLVDRLEASGVRPDALVVTGDLADKGEPDAYATLRSILEPAAERLGTRIIWAAGNHDDRSNLRTELLGEPAGTTPLDHVSWLGGLRLITLDTTVPGSHHGHLEDTQLRWLEAELATPAPDGTILSMHHPPIASVQPLAILVELRGQARLAEVLAGSDVRAILAGHLHYSTFGTFAGIPVSVASASCYTQDLAARADPVRGIHTTRGRDEAQGYNLVHVLPETVVHSVVPVASGVSVGDVVEPEEVAAILREHGIDPDTVGRSPHSIGAPAPGDDGGAPAERDTIGRSGPPPTGRPAGSRPAGSR